MQAYIRVPSVPQRGNGQEACSCPGLSVGASPGRGTPRGLTSIPGPESQLGPKSLARMQGLGRPGPPHQEAAGKARDLRRGHSEAVQRKQALSWLSSHSGRRMTGTAGLCEPPSQALQLGFIVLSKVGNGTHIMGCRPQTPSLSSSPTCRRRPGFLATVCREDAEGRGAICTPGDHCLHPDS